MENKSWIFATFQKIYGVELSKSVYYSAVFCLFILLVTYLFMKFDKNKQVPGLKLPWYKIFGHISYRIVNYQQYSFNTYFMCFMLGMSKLFENNSIFSMRIMNQAFVILHKADACEALLKSAVNIEKSSDYKKLHMWLLTGIFTSKGLKWESRRKLLIPLFHFDFLPVLNEKSKILVEILKERTDEEWVDIVKPLTLCSLDIICEITLGVDINAQRNPETEYVQAISRVIKMTIERMTNPKRRINFTFFLSRAGKEYVKDVKILHNFSRNVIEKRKRELLQTKADSHQNEPHCKQKALMDLLLYHHIDHKDFSEEDIREEVDTITYLGHDTISAALSWCLYLIGLYPEMQKKIHDELDKIFDDDDRHITNDDLRELQYLECVIKETQRLYPTAPFIAREITKDFTLCGYPIKSGTVCLLFVRALHRDSTVFPDPEIFDPERFFPKNAIGRNPYAYVPFSAGPRNCMGERFAMMELKVVLASVLRLYSVRSLEHRDKLLPESDVILRPSRPVKMKISLRKEMKG